MSERVGVVDDPLVNSERRSHSFACSGDFNKQTTYESEQRGARGTITIVVGMW